MGCCCHAVISAAACRAAACCTGINLWDEQIPERTLVVLGGQDILSPTMHVDRWLREHTHAHVGGQETAYKSVDSGAVHLLCTSAADYGCIHAQHTAALSILLAGPTALTNTVLVRCTNAAVVLARMLHVVNTEQ